MKRILTLAILLATVATASAQPMAMDGVAEYQKKKMPASVIELPYSPEVVEKAIADKFAAQGIKPVKMRDYQLYRNVPMGSLATNYDVYVKTERKSRKEKDASVVTMVLLRPNEMIENRRADDNHGNADGRQFLNDFTPHMVEYNLSLEVIAQEEHIRKLEKKHEGMIKDGATLRKRREKLDQEILENENNIKNSILTIEKQKVALDALRTRQKNKPEPSQK